MAETWLRSVSHLYGLCSRQQSSAEGQEDTAASISQKTEVANAGQAPREDMFEETAEEFLVS